MSTGPQLPTTIASWAIWIVCALAIVAVVLVASQAFGVAIPSWIVTIMWICLAVVIVVGAIKFISGRA